MKLKTILAVILSFSSVSQCSHLKQQQCHLPDYQNMMIQPGVCYQQSQNGTQTRISQLSADQLPKQLEPHPESGLPVDVQPQVLKAKRQLVLWLKEMKEVWKDFPEHRSDLDGSDPVKFFGDCRFDQKSDFAGILNFDEKSWSCFSKFGVTRVNGSFVGGDLNGFSTVHFLNGSLIRAPFVNGSLSGLARWFTCLYGSCDFDYEPWNVPDRLAEVSLSLYVRHHRHMSAVHFKQSLPKQP